MLEKGEGSRSQADRRTGQLDLGTGKQTSKLLSPAGEPQIDQLGLQGMLSFPSRNRTLLREILE